MFGGYEEYDFGGHKYIVESWCLGEDVYYVKPDGEWQRLPVFQLPMTATDAMKIHAMNMNGYSP